MYNVYIAASFNILDPRKLTGEPPPPPPPQKCLYCFVGVFPPLFWFLDNKP